MRFNQHSDVAGYHAFLSASKHAWVNYTDEKLDRAYIANRAAARGTAMHDLARDLIRMGVNLPRNQKTINRYVNDGIGFRMEPEQVLYFSPNAFGTADTISFRKELLRISDLKTGITPTSMRQLEVYAALFCLEYRYKPNEITMELRIYQNDDVKLHIPDPVDILLIMEKIVAFDKRINTIREEEL
jgi:Protein of unknown function (DUF2800)